MFRFLLILFIVPFTVVAQLESFLSLSSFNSTQGPYLETYLSVNSNTLKLIKNSENFYSGKVGVVVNVYSTLGMELLSRGKKVLFLDLYHYVARHSFIPNNSSGLFWTNENSEKEIENKIESLLNIKDNQWNAELQKYNLGLKFDYKNTILVKLVNELIEK